MTGVGLLKRLALNTDERSLAHRFRQKRFEWLTARLAVLPKPVRVLDVGGTEIFWRRMDYGFNGEIDLTLLNLQEEAVSLPFARSVAGDARDLSRFADKEFDLVFSNSVIEHLGLFRDQLLMAREIRRVGRRYFVQTPNRYFPLEPHALVPFFQFVPRRLAAAVLARRPVGWIPKATDRAAAIIDAESLRLLDKRELRLLFPDAQILEERLGPLVKSYVATSGWD
jgi:hypothetical protein